MKGYAARRPTVLGVLKDIEDHCWGWYVEFFGGREELIRAGVASAEMFDLPKSGGKTGRDEFGDRYIIRSRPGDRFLLTRSFDEEARDRGNQGKGRGGKALGADVCAEVDAIIERCQSRREAQP